MATNGRKKFIKKSGDEVETKSTVAQRYFLSKECRNDRLNVPEIISEKKFNFEKKSCR